MSPEHTPERCSNCLCTSIINVNEKGKLYWQQSKVFEVGMSELQLALIHSTPYSEKVKLWKAQIIPLLHELIHFRIFKHTHQDVHVLVFKNVKRIFCLFYYLSSPHFLPDFTLRVVSFYIGCAYNAVWNTSENSLACASRLLKMFQKSG